MSRRTSMGALVSLCALIVAGIGGVLGYALRPTETPQLLAAATEEIRAPVTSQPFDDSRKVQVRLVTAKTQTLALRTGGTITSSHCADDAFISGEVLADIDDKPLIGLNTTVPLYRDLSCDDDGADVQALQEELARLGYLDSESVDGWYGWETRHAVQLLRDASGSEEDSATTWRSEFIWLPFPTATGITCELQVGAEVSDGTTLATVEGVIDRLKVEKMPEALAPGARTLTVAGVTGPVSESGEATDPEFLAQIGANKQLIAALRGDPEARLTASLALAETIEAYTLPVGAIINDGDKHCVQSDDGTFPVTIVGSTLGSAVVTFPNSADLIPKSVVIGSQITEARCA